MGVQSDRFLCTLDRVVVMYGELYSGGGSREITAHLTDRLRLYELCPLNF